MTCDPMFCANYLSVIIPVYNEGAHIDRSIDTIANVLNLHLSNYRFVLVDDGSVDNSWERIATVKQAYPSTVAIQLSRNFGKEAAIWAGIEASLDSAVLIMDADLQHPPELIPEMVRLWQLGQYDIIEGVKYDRGKECSFYRLLSRFFYRLYFLISGYDLDNSSDYKLLDQHVVKQMATLPEVNVFFRGLSSWIGYRRIQVPFRVCLRTQGESTWSNWGLFRYAVNALTSFSSSPLQIITVLGAFFLLMAFILIIVALYQRFTGSALDGFTTVILVVLISGGMQMVSLGVLGLYIGRIFEETKKRPRYIVRNVLQ